MDLKNYKTIIECFKNFYPEERLDLCINNPILKRAVESGFKEKLTEEELECIKHSTNAMYVTIYYPSVTITNEHGRQHTILEVYVQHRFPFLTMVLGRAAYTQEELNVGYVHSHVQKYRFNSLNEFCLGSRNTPVNIIKQKIASNYYNDFGTLITSYIIESERTIRTESIEGTPYISMNNIDAGLQECIPISIKPRDDTSIFSYTIKRRIRDFISFYIRQGLDEFYYDGRSWQLRATDAEFIKRVTKVARLYKRTANYSRMYSPAIYSSGLYYKKDIDSTYTLTSHNTNYTFKGKKLDIKVLQRDKTDFVDVKIVNPLIINTVYWFLINFINGVYASDKYKYCLYSRAVKIKNCLLKAIGD